MALSLCCFKLTQERLAMNLGGLTTEKIGDIIAPAQRELLIRLRRKLGDDAAYVNLGTQVELVGGAISVTGIKVAEDAPNKKAIEGAITSMYPREMIVR